VNIDPGAITDYHNDGFRLSGTLLWQWSLRGGKTYILSCFNGAAWKDVFTIDHDGSSPVWCDDVFQYFGDIVNIQSDDPTTQPGVAAWDQNPVFGLTRIVPGVPPPPMSRLGTIVFEGGDNSNPNSPTQVYAAIASEVVRADPANLQGALLLATAETNPGTFNNTPRVKIQRGVQVLSEGGALPYGGDKGTGTINASGHYTGGIRVDRMPIFFTDRVTLNSGETRFYGLGISDTNEAAVSVPVPNEGFARYLNVKSCVQVSGNVTFTVFRNNQPTNLQASISGASSNANNAESIYFAASDTISLRAASTPGSSALPMVGASIAFGG
jgi:hypothetical protein